MIKSFAGIFEMSKLRKRVFFTLCMIVAYRLGVAVPVPGINVDGVRSLFSGQQSNSLLGFLNMFSGGALSRVSVFSMGIMPYINASIIMTLMQSSHVIPYLDKLAKEGEYGRKKLVQLTRYLTVVISVVQSCALTMAISKISTPLGAPIIVDSSISWIILIIVTLVTGTILIMWLGEQIAEQGIGNGISLIIFAGIVEKLPRTILSVVKLIRIEEISMLYAMVLMVVVSVILILVVWIETAQRKIPIHYAKRVVGRKLYGGQASFLPIKVDQSGVIAVIFSVSILSAPLTVAQFFPEWTIWGFPVARRIADWINKGSLLYSLVYAAFVIFFCYFYNAISFNPKEIAENIKKSGGFIPGIRPGEPTSTYIQKILERVTLGGALFVACIAVLPDYLRLRLNVPFFLGGTSLLIVVGVSLDTIGQIESQLVMRHYEGFTKDNREKGKWFSIKKI
ncbi:MAG: preprotein translocase subunit SecY [Endomicrobium sp.]|jgi:preprotein translocase subunit SecY|nr:preprotein translocase subunit SecY [Endomicrobium sp.]